MVRTKKYVCIECDGPMEPADDKVLVCNSCGYSVDIVDYGHENDYSDYYSKKSDSIPKECEACGGPYPSCTTSCKLFD